MSETVTEDIKRWTAKRKSALVIEIIQGKTTVAEASRTYDLAPSEVESWVEDGRKGMENALKANPLDVRQQYEKQLRDLQEAYGEAMLELRARKSSRPCWTRRTANDPERSAGPSQRWNCRAGHQALRLVRRTAAHNLLQTDQCPAEDWPIRSRR